MTALDDRLRSHFADRTAREPLPGPSTDESWDELRGHGRVTALPSAGERRGGAWIRHHRRLAVAAAVLLVALLVGGGLLVRERRLQVSTDPTPSPTTTDRPDRRERPGPSTPTPVPPPVGPTTPPPPGGRPTGPIVGADGILGTWNGVAWVPWAPGSTPPDGLAFQVVGIAGPVRTATGPTVTRGCGAGDIVTVDLGLSAPDGSDAGDARPVGIAGVQVPQPRPVEELDRSSAVYQQAAAEVLGSLGSSSGAPVQVHQVVRADLDGDGTTEVLVSADRVTSPIGQAATPGDGTVLFLRRTNGGSVDTQVLQSYLVTSPDYGPFVPMYQVGAVADLNGDGRMEMVVDMAYYEGSEVTVHELRPDGTAPEVLSSGCGV